MPIHFSRFPIKQFDFFETQAVNQVLEGEGVGWLKVNRIRKLMEDENYRNLVVSRLNKTLEQKIGPDEHIDDVVRIEKYLKLFQMDFLTWFQLDLILVCESCGVERDAETAPGRGCGIGANLRESRFGRDGFDLPTVGDCSYPLLDTGHQRREIVWICFGCRQP